MTDRETLYTYRLQQAEETCREAEKMAAGGFSPRSITNRAYYAMFYAVLALCIRHDVGIKSSKHAGILSLFDREFVRSGKLDKRYSKMLHEMFDARQQADYQELTEITAEEAEKNVRRARAFFTEIKKLL